MTKAEEKVYYELWIEIKFNLKHLHTLGCPIQVWPHRSNERKLNLITVSCYFIGYFERSRGYKFCDPITNANFDMFNTQFFEDIESVRKRQLGTLFFKKNMLIFVNTLL